LLLVRDGEGRGDGALAARGDGGRCGFRGGFRVDFRVVFVPVDLVVRRLC
jgi:hypothetical protein